MSNLVFEPKWNASINQVEAGEEIRGGVDGTANIATKQLAENIFYLKDNIFSLVGYIPPDLSEDVAEIVQSTKDRFDTVINQVIIQNEAILAESRDRIAAVAAANELMRIERDERIAKYDAINSALSQESAKRIQDILDEQLQRREDVLNSAIAQEALLAAESKVLQDKLLSDASALNTTIAALGTRVDADLASLTGTITQTSIDASTASEANANIINALKLEYEGNKASVLQKYTALATESLAQAELLTNLRASVAGSQAELTNFKSATATKDLATATEITALKTTVSGNAASFNTQITTVSDKASANTTQLTALSSKMNTVEGQAADLIIKNTTVTTLSEATAEALRLLKASYGLSTASFDERITTTADANQALTTKVSNLEAATGTSLASIRQKQETLTNEDLALAKSIQTLTSTFDGQTAQFSDQLTTLASENLASVQKTENLRAQLLGGYDGTDLDQVSEGLLHQEKIARVTDKESLVQQIGLLAAGVGEQFDPKEIWHFSAEPEGWTGGVFQEGYLKVTNETVISPAFTLSGTAYRYMKMRLIRTGTPTWQGKLTYNNISKTPKTITIPEPLFVDNVATIDVDTKWAGPVTDIQLKLASTGNASNYILIDWVAIGRPSPGASSSALLDLKTTSATRDEALSQSITQLNAALNTKTAELNSTINTKTETLTTAQQTQASNIVTLESKVDTIDSTLSSSISRNDETITTKHNALATTVTTLKSNTDNANALVTTQLETLTTADTALGTRIDSLTTSLGNTKADIIATNKTFVAEDKALALSIGALTTSLNTNTASIQTQLESLVTKDKSFASDLSSLSVRFSTAEGAIAKNSVDVLAETTARADAISAQATKTNTLEVKVDGNNSAITSRIDAEVTKTNATAESLTMLRSEFDDNSAAYINKFKSITDAAAAEAVKLDAITTEFGTNKSTVANEITTINNAAESLAQQVTQLSSNFDTNTADYTTKFKALTDKDKSLGDSLTALTASFTVVEGEVGTIGGITRQNTVDITEEARVRANAVSAEATRINALTTKVDGNIAEVKTKTDALTTSTNANAAQITTISGQVAGNKATIKSNNDVQVALNAVTASKIDTVSAEIEGGYSDKTHYALKNKSIQWTRTTSIAEALFNSNEKINVLNSEFGKNVASFSESIKTLTNENVSLAERTTELATSFEAETGTIKENVTLANSKITTLQQSISDTNGTLATTETRLRGEFKTEIDSIEVGGRNLAIGQDFNALTSKEGWVRRDITVLTNQLDPFGGQSAIKATSIGTDSSIYLVDSRYRGDSLSFMAEESGTYTLSVYLRADTPRDFTIRMTSRNMFNHVKLTDTWKKYSVTAEHVAGQPVKIELGGYIVWNASDTQPSIYFSHLKYEKGNKATDWTPAPEDTIGYIDSEISKVNTKVDSKADIIRVDSIENDANQALATTKTELTVSYKQAINEIVIGGRNLLKGTSSEATETNYEFYAYKDLAPIFEEHGLIEYTISVDLKTPVPGNINIYAQNGSGTKYSIGTKSCNVTTTWQRFTHTFTALLDASTTQTMAMVAFYGTYNTGRYIQLRNFKIEKGNKATDWSPAPEDVEADYTAKITSESTARANADGSIINTVNSLITKTDNTNAEINRVNNLVSDNKQSIAQTKTDITAEFVDKNNLFVLSNTTSGFETLGGITASNPQHKIMLNLVKISPNIDLKIEQYNPNLINIPAISNRIAFFDKDKIYLGSTALINPNGLDYNEQVITPIANTSFIRIGVITDESVQYYITQDIDKSLESNKAAISSEATTRANEDGALSTRINTVKATADNAQSRVGTVETAVANANSSIASTKTDLIAKFNEAKDYSNLKSSIFVINGNTKKFINPISYSNDAPNLVGYLIIETPITPERMANIKLSGYNYSNQSTISLNVGFYNHGGAFINAGYESLGRYKIDNLQLAKKTSDNRAVIIIGLSTSVWEYPKIVVEEAIVGYSWSDDSYLNGFNMSINNDISAYHSVVAISGVDLQGALQENSAAITAESTARADADGAIINTVNSLITKTDNTNAEINRVNNLVSDNKQSIAQTKTALIAEFVDKNNLYVDSDTVSGHETQGGIEPNNIVHRIMKNLIKITPYINLKIEMYNPNGTTFGGVTNRIAFFNKDKAHIGSIEVIKPTQSTYLEQVITPPVNSEFIRIGVIKDDSVSYIVTQDIGKGLESNKAAVTSEATTRANEDGALSTRINDVKATADNAQARVGTVETAVATNTSSIASTKTEVTAAYKQAINDIEIGGRNLLKGVNFADTISKTGWTVRGLQVSSNQIDPFGGNNAVCLTSVSVDSSLLIFNFNTNSISDLAMESGTYTISFYMRSTEPRTLGYSFSDTNRAIMNITTVWTKYTITRNMVNGIPRLEIGGYNYWNNTDSVTSIYFSHIKLEKGNKATDWTPAPEETTAAIQGTVETINRVEATVNGIKAEASVITTVGNKVSGWKNLNTGTTSNFDVWADRFAVWNGYNNIAPFIINGSSIEMNVPLRANSSITTPSISGGSIKIGSITGSVDEVDTTNNATRGTMFKVSDGEAGRSAAGFRLVSRDATGGLELSSFTRALTVWEGDVIRVKLGKL